MQAVRLNIHVLAYASKCHHDRRKKKCEAESAILESPASAFKRSHMQAERLNIHVLADAPRCSYDRRQKVRG